MLGHDKNLELLYFVHIMKVLHCYYVLI